MQILSNARQMFYLRLKAVFEVCLQVRNPHPYNWKKALKTPEISTFSSITDLSPVYRVNQNDGAHSEQRSPSLVYSSIDTISVNIQKTHKICLSKHTHVGWSLSHGTWDTRQFTA